MEKARKPRRRHLGELLLSAAVLIASALAYLNWSRGPELGATLALSHKTDAATLIHILWVGTREEFTEMHEYAMDSVFTAYPQASVTYYSSSLDVDQFQVYSQLGYSFRYQPITSAFKLELEEAIGVKYAYSDDRRKWKEFLTAGILIARGGIVLDGNAMLLKKIPTGKGGIFLTDSEFGYAISVSDSARPLVRSCYLAAIENETSLLKELQPACSGKKHVYQAPSVLNNSIEVERELSKIKRSFSLFDVSSLRSFADSSFQLASKIASECALFSRSTVGKERVAIKAPSFLQFDRIVKDEATALLSDDIKVAQYRMHGFSILPKLEATQDKILSISFQCTGECEGFVVAKKGCTSLQGISNPITWRNLTFAKLQEKLSHLRCVRKHTDGKKKDSAVFIAVAIKLDSPVDSDVSGAFTIVDPNSIVTICFEGMDLSETERKAQLDSIRRWYPFIPIIMSAKGSSNFVEEQNLALVSANELSSPAENLNISFARVKTEYALVITGREYLPLKAGSIEGLINALKEFDVVGAEIESTDRTCRALGYFCRSKSGVSLSQQQQSERLPFYNKEGCYRVDFVRSMFLAKTHLIRDVIDFDQATFSHPKETGYVEDLFLRLAEVQNLRIRVGVTPVIGGLLPKEIPRQFSWKKFYEKHCTRQ